MNWIHQTFQSQDANRPAINEVTTFVDQNGVRQTRHNNGVNFPLSDSLNKHQLQVLTAAITTQGDTSTPSVITVTCKDMAGKNLGIEGNLLRARICNDGTNANSTNATIAATTGSVLIESLTSNKDIVIQGGSKVETITCVADSSDSLDAKYFTLYDSAGSVGVWIDTDDSGTTIPAGASALDRAIEVTTIATDDTAADVATAVASAINADSKFVATSSGAVVTVTHVDTGFVATGADGDAGFTVALVNEGEEHKFFLQVTDGTAETVRLICGPAPLNATGAGDYRGADIDLTHAAP